MKCELCQGTGKISTIRSKKGGQYFIDFPCPVCGGCGTQYCCEGECAESQGKDLATGVKEND